MDSHLLITLAVTLIAAILFLSERLSADLVALLALVTLGVTGVLTPQEAFSGFSRSAVITVISIFILTEGLKRTGVTERVGRLLLRASGRREWWQVTVVMLTGAFLSLFMNNIAAASLLLPAVLGAAHRSQVKPSRLLMPLAFATILGGMATLLTTTNIVASTLLRDYQLAGYGMLDFLPLGAPIVLSGVIYMVTWGRHRLPQQAMSTAPVAAADLVEIYRLEERLLWVKIAERSPMVGRALLDCGFRETFGLNVVAVERDGRVQFPVTPAFVFRADDVLVLEGRLEKGMLQKVHKVLEVLPPRRWERKDLESRDIVVIEAVLSPRSSLIGQTLQRVRFRDRFGMTVLAVWRAGRPIRSGLATLPLQFGDALLLQGPREKIEILRLEADLIVPGGEARIPAPVQGKAWLAILILAASLTFSILQPNAIGEVMLAGAVTMILVGLLSMDQAYRAIEWKTVFLVAGLLPLGIAIAKTGLAALAAQTIANLLGPAGPLALLAGLTAMTVMLTQVMNGAAVAAIMAPIAIQASQSFGVEPRSLVMGVTLATSMAFITPLGHPVNLLVMGPGGYRFRDYIKVGLPLTVILFLLMVGLLPFFWPLTR